MAPKKGRSGSSRQSRTQARAQASQPTRRAAKPPPQRQRPRTPDRTIPTLPRQRAITLGAVAILCLFIFWQLHPSLTFANTTPTGGDLGGHVWGPPFMQKHLTADGLLSGWSSDWFAGFPAYRFYMALPAFGIVLLHIVWSWGVALKLGVVLPLIALPAAAACLGQVAGLDFPGPIALAASTLPFLFDNSYFKFGGNIASTVVGEYGFAWSMLFAVLTIASFERDLTRSKRKPLTAVLVALAALCHPIGGLLVLVAIGVRTALAHNKAALIHAAIAAGLGAVISAFWYLPLWSYRLYTNDLSFTRQTNFGRLFFPLNPALELLIAAAVIVGVVDAVRRQKPLLLTLAITGALFAFGVLIAPRGYLWNGRLLPVYHLTRMLLGGAGAAAAIRHAAPRIPQPRRTIAFLAAPLVSALLICVGISWDTGTLPLGSSTLVKTGGWKYPSKNHWLVGPTHTTSLDSQFIDIAFGGYERGPAWNEYKQLVTKLHGLAGAYGCGRVFPENDATARYGTTVALTLLPELSNGCLSVVSGLYRDSSPTSSFELVAESALSDVYDSYKPGLPYEQLNLTRGLAYLREFGVRFYLAHSSQAVTAASATQGLTDLGAVGQWTIFLVEDSPLVSPLAQNPTVTTSAPSRAGWEKVGLQWFKQANPQAPRPSTSGPKNWPHGKTPQVQPQALPAVQVTGLKAGNNRIAFTVDTPGVPMLVRESYFPTWKVDGATGPYRVAPNWMVVIPTKNNVVLHTTRGGPETLGAVLTVLGLLAAITLAGIKWGDRGMSS